MDPIRSIAVPRHSAETTAIQPSAQPLPSVVIDQLEMLGRQLQGNYASQEVTLEQGELLMAAWEEVARKHGIDVVRAALLNHMRSSKFLPTLADFEQHVDLILDKRRISRMAEESRLERERTREAEQRWRAENPGKQPLRDGALIMDMLNEVRERQGKVRIEPKPKARPVAVPEHILNCPTCGRFEPRTAEEADEMVKMFQKKATILRLRGV